MMLVLDIYGAFCYLSRYFTLKLGVTAGARYKKKSSFFFLQTTNYKPQLELELPSNSKTKTKTKTKKKGEKFFF